MRNQACSARYLRVARRERANRTLLCFDNTASSLEMGSGQGLGPAFLEGRREGGGERAVGWVGDTNQPITYP